MNSPEVTPHTPPTRRRPGSKHGGNGGPPSDSKAAPDPAADCFAQLSIELQTLRYKIEAWIQAQGGTAPDEHIFALTEEADRISAALTGAVLCGRLGSDVAELGANIRRVAAQQAGQLGAAHLIGEGSDE